MHRFAFSLFFVSIAAFAQSSETIPFRAIMLPQNEVPAVNIAASGTATVWLHVVRDARGQVVSASTDFDVSYRFPGEVQFTGLHIHKGRSGENGPVTIDSGIRAAQPVASEGTGRTRLQGFTAPDNAAGLDTVNGMLTDPSGFYVNMHTTVYPGGAFRAQLQRAEMTVLISQLSPLNEVPAITDIAASGLGSIVALMTRDGGGNVSSGLVIFDANYTGLPEGTTFTGFHLHDGVRGVNGPVTINTGIAAGANSVAAVAAGGNLHYEVEVPVNNPAAVNTLAGIFSRPGQFYMNLHTSVYPGGVMRNQLRTTDTNRYQVNMSSANEVPPAGVTASAPSVFQAHTVRNSAGAIEAAVAIFDVNYRMPGTSTFTGLHIHNGKVGENGPVTVDSGLNARTPLISDSGNGNIYRIVTVNSAMALATLNSATSTPDLNYLNLHTTTFPGGIVRSQLAAENKTTPAV
ncbi:MAG: CHRD domain-containing protein, partial [Bryobacteraceae bacterium]|nr:CHRD domain-containing protein [Bryobacteraceae bacterium]